MYKDKIIIDKNFTIGKPSINSGFTPIVKNINTTNRNCTISRNFRTDSKVTIVKKK